MQHITSNGGKGEHTLLQNMVVPGGKGEGGCLLYKKSHIFNTITRLCLQEVISSSRIRCKALSNFKSTWPSNGTPPCKFAQEELWTFPKRMLSEAWAAPLHPFPAALISATSSAWVLEHCMFRIIISKSSLQECGWGLLYHVYIVSFTSCWQKLCHNCMSGLLP